MWLLGFSRGKVEMLMMFGARISLTQLAGPEVSQVEATPGRLFYSSPIFDYPGIHRRWKHKFSGRDASSGSHPSCNACFVAIRNDCAADWTSFFVVSNTFINAWVIWRRTIV